jgi:hypothetical protein
MFDHQDVEVERKVRCEILQARSSKQKGLEDERADLLQNHPSRFSNHTDGLLEQKMLSPILQDMEQERKDRSQNQTDRF